MVGEDAIHVLNLDDQMMVQEHRGSQYERGRPRILPKNAVHGSQDGESADRGARIAVRQPA